MKGKGAKITSIVESPGMTVLVVLDGGVAHVAYCPPGCVVIVKDYDQEGADIRPGVHFQDQPGVVYAREVVRAEDTAKDLAAREEAYMQRVGQVKPADPTPRT